MQTSWDLLRRSWQVIRSNPKLLFFPIVSTMCALLLVCFFLAPVAAVIIAKGGFHPVNWADLPQHWKGFPLYLYGMAIYLGAMFVGTFFNVALYDQIFKALAGDPVSIGAGLRFAVTKIRAIFLWSLLAGTVGLVIRSIGNRLGWIDQIGLSLLGVAWSVAAVFAIPVIIRRENGNPMAVLRDSAAIVKRTWGESLIGFVGIRLGSVVIVAGAILVGGLTTVSTGFGLDAGLLVVVWACWALAFAGILFFTAMATHVYRCALYVYASEGVIPGPFTTEMMNAAWKVKKA